MTADLHAPLNDIVQSVAYSLLGSDAVPCAAMREPSVEQLYVGTVDISGGWRGRIYITCPDRLARLIASAMMGERAETITPDDARDAVAELANIIGGNLKSFAASFDAACALSLPRVSGVAPPYIEGRESWFMLESVRLRISIEPEEAD